MRPSAACWGKKPSKRFEDERRVDRVRLGRCVRELRARRSLDADALLAERVDDKDDADEGHQRDQRVRQHLLLLGWDS